MITCESTAWHSDSNILPYWQWFERNKTFFLFPSFTLALFYHSHALFIPFLSLTLSIYIYTYACLKHFYKWFHKVYMQLAFFALYYLLQVDHVHITSFFFFKIYFNLFIFNWRTITLLYCVGFCHISTWISHRYTCVPFLLSLPSISHPSRLSQGSFAVWLRELKLAHITSLSLSFPTCQTGTMILPTTRLNLKGRNFSGEVLALCPVCDRHLRAVNHKQLIIT